MTTRDTPEMSDEHAQLAEMIETLRSSLDDHLRIGHASYMERSEIERMVSSTSSATAANSRRLEVLITMWKGPIDELTGERREEEGLEGTVLHMKSDVAQLLKMTSNGGVPARVKSSDRTAIYVAAVSGLLTAIAAIVVAWIQFT